MREGWEKGLMREMNEWSMGYGLLSENANHKRLEAWEEKAGNDSQSKGEDV